MRKENSNFKTKFISEQGSYLRNLDYFAFVEMEDYACYCIADGIDNDPKRESAQIAVSAIITEFHENPGFTKRRIKKFLNIANQALHNESKEARLEASIVVVITDYKKIMWASAGNARLFFIRNNNVKFKTSDHSLSQDMAKEGDIPLDQIEFHEERHNLYCYLGQAEKFKPTVSSKRRLEDGDILVLYTRGVWECIGTPELLDAIEEASEPEQVCTGLEDIILCQQQDVVENYTIVSIFVDKIYRNPKASKLKKYTKIILTILISIAIIVGILMFSSYRKQKENLAQMQKYKDRGVSYMVDGNYTSASKEFIEAYELADKMKVRKKSKSYKEIELVEIYNKTAAYLVEAEEALAESEYKKAVNKYQSFIDGISNLQQKYEVPADYLTRVKNRLAYANAMKEGYLQYESELYEKAKEYYIEAETLADSMDDTPNRTQADKMLKNTNAKIAIVAGAEFETNGDIALEGEQYQKALNQYESARASYALAKEEYGSIDSDSKISLVDIKIQNASNSMNKQTTQELEEEASQYVSQGNQAYHDKNYKSAIENFELAKDIYKTTENTGKVSDMDEKIDTAKIQPSKEDEEEEAEAVEEEQTLKEKASKYLLDASEAFANEEYEEAIDNYSLTQELYDKLQMSEESKKLGRIIKQIKNLQKEKEKEIKNDE